MVVASACKEMSAGGWKTARPPKETMGSADTVRQFALKEQWQRRNDRLGIGTSFK
jgi:hypothetical protein